MNQPTKGKKGFQKVPKELQLTERYSIKMTKAELSVLNDYCKSNNVTKANVIRTALKDFYRSNGVIV